VTALEKLRRFAAAGDWRAAIKLAASWPRLGEHKEVIERAWAACSHPETYRDMGQDPDALFAAGVAAIKAKYNLPGDQT